MSGTVLTAREKPAELRFAFHLDDSATIRDPKAEPPKGKRPALDEKGQPVLDAAGAPVILPAEEDTRPFVPDPAFVREYTWTKPPQGQGESPSSYAKSLKTFVEMASREATLLAQHEAAQLAASLAEGDALAIEGEAF